MADDKIILKGLPASPGIVGGKVAVIIDPKEQDKVSSGNILVTQFTTPLLTTAITKSSGIVTDEGGIMCHAAIIAREFGIPCVVGTKEATKKLKDGTEVIVDGTKGYVYKK